MTITVLPRQEVSDDLRKLGSNALRLEASMKMVELESHPYMGQPLGIHPTTGDLSDCRKIPFDNYRHRIVYRLRPNEMKPTEADVIVVGPREALEVYDLAVSRLGRAS